GMTDPAYPFVYFMSWKLSSFTGLSALCHFYLQLIRIRQVIACNTKPSGGDLFDRRPLPIAVVFSFVSDLVLSSFPTVAFASDSVHGNRQGSVGLERNGAKGHGTCGETFHDILDRLYFVEGNGIAFFELKHSPQGQHVS